MKFKDGKIRTADRLEIYPWADLPILWFNRVPLSEIMPGAVWSLEPDKPGATAGVERWTARVNRTLIRQHLPEARPRFRFRDATWTLHINRNDATLQLLEVTENWDPTTPGKPDGVLRLKERYLDQRFNPVLTDEDFAIAPLPPVRPAEPEPQKPKE